MVILKQKCMKNTEELIKSKNEVKEYIKEYKIDFVFVQNFNEKLLNFFNELNQCDVFYLLLLYSKELSDYNTTNCNIIDFNKTPVDSIILKYDRRKKLKSILK